MPIRRELYPADWPAISLEVRSAAGWCCEWCGAPHLKVIQRTGRWQQVGEHRVDWKIVTSVLETTGLLEPLGEFVPTAGMKARRLRYHGLTKIVITTAHLDRDPANNDRANLAALCQRCHLRYDIMQHVRTRKYGVGHEEQPKLFNINH